MEKLIELLNEYEEKEILNMYEWEIEGEDILAYSKFRDGYETINVGESIIISKWYEFIKWLVDNDKIDMIILGKIGMYGDLEQCRINTTNAIIMILSITENPIEFLISILK